MQRPLRNLLVRRAAVLYALAAAGFLAATALPLRFTNPFVTSQVSALEGGGMRILRRSLVAGAAAPPALNAASYRESAFSIALTVRPMRDDLFGPARIVAYSMNPDFQNWIIGQKGDDLVVRRCGREAVFPGVLRRGEVQALLVTIAPEEATLEVDGKRLRPEPLAGRLRPWNPHCRLVLGNETTGDRPWVGEIRSLRIQGGSDAPALVLGREGEQWALRDAAGASYLLQVVRWPWALKLESILHQSHFERGGSVRDVVVNVCGTLPLGALLAFVLRRRRTVPILAAAILSQLALSLLAETHQFFAYYRHADPMDVGANVAGAFLGAFLVTAGRRLRTRASPSAPAR